jgi:hypothetical protein
VIHYFCDVCGNKIASPETQISGRRGRIQYTITRALDGTWNGGQVCRPCVVEAIQATPEATP